MSVCKAQSEAQTPECSRSGVVNWQTEVLMQTFSKSIHQSKSINPRFCSRTNQCIGGELPIVQWLQVPAITILCCSQSNALICTGSSLRVGGVMTDFHIFSIHLPSVVLLMNWNKSKIKTECLKMSGQRRMSLLSASSLGVYPTNQNW